MSFADLNAAVATSVTALDALAAQTTTTGNSFADLLAKMSGYQAFGGMGQLNPKLDASGQPVIGADGKPEYDNSGPTSIGELLKQLAAIIAAEKDFYSGGGANFGLLNNPAVYEDSIQKIVAAIRTWGGPDATSFDLEQFKKWLTDQEVAAAKPGASSPAASPAAGSAPASLVGAPKPEMSQFTGNSAMAEYQAALSRWQVANPSPGIDRRIGPSGQISYPAEEKKAADAAAAAELAKQQQAIDELTASEGKFKADLDSANAVLTETQARMTAMQSAALDPTTGVVTKINADMADAKATLQYLIDKGSDAASVAAQTKVVADLQTKLDEASKQQRIATYEFEHSTAYKQQQDEIAAEKADIAKKQAVYDETATKIADAQKALDAATTKAADNATKVATDLTHSTDILRNVAATTGTKLTDAAAGIEKAGDRVLMFTNQALGALGVATTKAVTDITKAASTTANSIGAWMSRGLLP